MLTDQETGQTIIAGMGELHLEIIVDRLLREFKVEANVGAAIQLVGQAGDHMLAGVALHPAEAEGPIQGAVDGSAGGEGTVGDVNDGVGGLSHVQDVDLVQGALVGGLAAALGEEGGLVQNDAPCSGFSWGAGEDGGGESATMAVVVIEFDRHDTMKPFLRDSLRLEQGDGKNCMGILCSMLVYPVVFCNTFHTENCSQRQRFACRRPHRTDPHPSHVDPSGGFAVSADCQPSATHF